jgi:hypothetical protein
MTTQAHALRTFLNSSSRELQRAGTKFEAEDGYVKELEQRGIVTTAPGADKTLQPPRNQALNAAPSTLRPPVAPLTSGSLNRPPPVPTVTPPAPAKKSR